METCGTCKLWTRHVDTWDGKLDEWGDCKCPKVRSNGDPPKADGASFYARDTDSKDPVCLRTGQAFGCIHHEQA